MTKSKTIPGHNPNPTPEDTKEAHAIAMAIVDSLKELQQEQRAKQDQDSSDRAEKGESTK